MAPGGSKASASLPGSLVSSQQWYLSVIFRDHGEGRLQRESEKTFLSVCRKCPGRKWLTPVPLTGNIGSANWEWGRRTTSMDGGWGSPQWPPWLAADLCLQGKEVDSHRASE